MTCEIFGIVNVTPDSFSDGGAFFSPPKAMAHAYSLLADGAHFIDIGGESTRPNATIVSSEEEWGRVEEIITTLLADSTIKDKISLDTRNPSTAEKFFKLGGGILNDVTGFRDAKMKDLAAEFAKKVIVGHFPGKTLVEVHEQEMCSINQIRDELLTRHEELIRAGLSPEKIVLDPNIGFGKTMKCNEELLRFAELVPGYEVMIGHSRKRFLGENRKEVEPNLKAAQIAIDSGARYLRVHDVREHAKILN